MGYAHVERSKTALLRTVFILWTSSFYLFFFFLPTVKLFSVIGLLQKEMELAVQQKLLGVPTGETLFGKTVWATLEATLDVPFSGNFFSLS